METLWVMSTSKHEWKGNSWGVWGNQVRGKVGMAGFLQGVTWVNEMWQNQLPAIFIKCMHLFLLINICLCFMFVSVCRIHPACLPTCIWPKADRWTDGNSDRLGKCRVLWWVYVTLVIDKFGNISIERRLLAFSRCFCIETYHILHEYCGALNNNNINIMGKVSVAWR